MITLPWILAEIIPLLPPAQRSNTLNCQCHQCSDHHRHIYNHHHHIYNHHYYHHCYGALTLPITSPWMGRLRPRNSSQTWWIISDVNLAHDYHYDDDWRWSRWSSLRKATMTTKTTTRTNLLTKPFPSQQPAACLSSAKTPGGGSIFQTHLQFPFTSLPLLFGQHS